MKSLDICQHCQHDPCICDDSHGFVTETKRMSAAVKLQRAFERERQKSAASRERAKELLQPKKPEPIKEGNGYDDNRTGFAKKPREDDEGHGSSNKPFRKDFTNDRPHTVHVDGKKWKTFTNGRQANAAAKTLESKGKKVSVMGHYKENVEQVDEIVKPDVKNDLKTLDPVSFVKKHGVKKGQAKSMAESSMAEKDAQKQYRNARKNDVPFDPPYSNTAKKPVATAGKFGQGYSTARHLARQAMNKVASKYRTPIKEEGELSKKAQIVKSAAKKGKKSDSFCADPVISKTEVKM